MLFSITGCSIEYNLNFYDEKFTENIFVKLNGKDYTIDKIQNIKDYNLLAISKGLEQVEYTKSFEDNSDEFIMNYQYQFTVDNFSKNNIINQCFDSFSLIEEDDYYLLSTGKNFTCLSIEYQIVSDYEINIKTNHKVLEHNADEVSNGTYIWKINNSGSQVSTTKPIRIKFSKDTVSSIWDNNMVVLGIVVLVIIFVGGIILLIARYKNKINNKI